MSNKFPERGQIFLVDEIACIILSNNAANQVSSHVIVAPIVNEVRNIFMFEVAVEINGKPGKILLDQIRTIDKARLGTRIGACDRNIINAIKNALKIILAIN